MKRADILSLFPQALSQTCSSHVKENRVNKKTSLFSGFLLTLAIVVPALGPLA